MFEINKVYNEDCLDTMRRMDDEFVDLIVTSPPYDDLRTYGQKKFSFEFQDIAQAMTRVLKKGGVIVWVVGDATIDGSETLTSFEQALYFKNICKLNMHDVMIYEKNTFPFPSSNRYHQVIEYMFILSKGKPKTFNPIIDEPVKYAGFTSRGKQTKRMPDGSLKEMKKARAYADLKMRSNVWRYAIGKNNTTPDEVAYKHPALFPEKLAEDMIISWSNENDLVYDPMGGSGTTAKMAIKHNRNWVLSEINKKYCNEIIKKRLKLNEGKDHGRRKKTRTKQE